MGRLLINADLISTSSVCLNIYNVESISNRICESSVQYCGVVVIKINTLIIALFYWINNFNEFIQHLFKLRTSAMDKNYC